MQHQHNLHLLLQIYSLISDNILRHRQLFEAFRVHKVVATIIFVDVFEIALFHEGTLNLLGRPIALGNLDPVMDAPHLEMRHGRAFTGMDVIRFEDRAQLAIDFEDVAFTDRTCDDPGQICSPIVGGHQPAEFDCAYYAFPALKPSALSVPGVKSRPMTTDHDTPWWDRARHQDRRPFLLARARIKQALRKWFTDQGFIEVETAALQVSPGNETHLHAFKTRFEPLDNAPGTDFYLHTSPEFACKKLLAAGETKIFTFAPSYRNREHGRIHHPEFTMLEWYRTDADYRSLMTDCAEMLRVAAKTIGVQEFRQLGANGEFTVPTYIPPEEISVADAFQRFANIDLRATYQLNSTNRDALATAATTSGIRTALDDTWSDIFTRILVEKVEPQLGRTVPTILKDYPIHEAALAAPAATDQMVAERFELYLCDLELANAFTELSDPAEQRRRFDADMSEKQRIYGERYPIDEDFLAALAHMPPAAGCAMGFDRLIMLATGAQRIDQVIWTPLPLS